VSVTAADVRPLGERRSAKILGRFAVREHAAPFWATLWVAALAAVLGALVPLVTGDPVPLRAQDVVFVLAAGSFMACGLIAWRRRPDNHAGRLMTAIGFAALIYPLLIQVEAPLAMTLAMLFSAVWTIGYAALLLSFMTGGLLTGTIDRLLVGVFTLTLFVAHFALLLVYPAPGNLLLIETNMTIADAINDSARWITAGASIVLVFVLLSRWRGASKPRRRALLPGVVGIVSSILYSILLVQGILGDTPADSLWITVNLSVLLVPAAYLFGLLRSRLARTGLAGLILQLRTMQGAELEPALGRALGDPSLRVVHGDVPPAPAPRQSVARIERDGRPVAALVYDESLDDDPELVEAVSAAAALALENEQLNAELLDRLDELRGSRARIVEATQKERQRLERNLHDGAQQRLVALSLELTLLEARFAKDPDAKAAVDSVRTELTESLHELRELARGIHPAVVTGHGLAVALESVATRSPVPVKLDVALDGRMPEAVEVAAYYIVAESLTNVAKYAGASSARVAVSRDDGELVVEITDDGVGGADEDAGSGLRGLADRVEALDGRLQVWSPRGGGTCVRAEIPCGS
jgi:signal transduction histidine kinase